MACHAGPRSSLLAFMAIMLAFPSGPGSPARAQLLPDDSLGAESSVVEPAILESQTSWIQGGAKRGINLFHSFQDFNIAPEQRVYFTNPAGIEQIFSRVTGNDASRIDGLLGVAGPADLFLLNPQGILFGPGAKLEISGTFLGTTALDFQWGNTQQFGISDPNQIPLLTTSIQPGLQWGSTTGKISTNGNLTAGQNLQLESRSLELQGQLQAGKNLTLRGGEQVQLNDSATKPFIAEAGGQLLVQGDRNLSIAALSHPESKLSAGGDLILRSANPISGDAQFSSGGNFRIQTLEKTPGALKSPNDPVIRAGGDVSFTDYQGSSLHILSGGQVTAENITILGAAIGAVAEDFLQETVALSNGSTVEIDGSTRPTLDIRAGISPNAIGNTLGNAGNGSGFNPAPVDSGSPTSANITLDNININASNGQVFLSNQYQPNSALTGGDIIVGTLRGDDNRGNRFTGNGSDFIVDARQDFRVANQVNTSASTGASGSIRLIVQGNTQLDQSYLTSNNNGAFEPGDITIQTRNLTALNGSQIQISSAGLGDAGKVKIIATDDVTFDSLLPLDAQPNPNSNAKGDRAGIDNRILNSRQANPPSVRSGGIEIDASNIIISDGAQFQVRVDNNARGTSGDIRLRATDLIAINGVSSEATSPSGASSSGLITSIEVGGEGKTGNIILEGGRVEVLDGGSLQSNTAGRGDAGDISITATESLQVGNSARNRNAFIQSRVNGVGIGDGGDITFNAPIVSIFNDAEILANSTPTKNLSGRGNAGEISIIAPQEVTIKDGAVVRTSVDDNGSFAGDILIETQRFELSTQSEIISSADGRFRGSKGGGNVDITASEFVLIQGSSKIATNQGDNSFGNAGDIVIESPKIQVTDRSLISSLSDGVGNGGEIILQAEAGIIRIENDSDIVANLERKGTGQAGSIVLIANEIQSINQSEISSRSKGKGNGGSITLQAQGGSIVLENEANVIANLEATGTGKAGNILLTANDITLLGPSPKIESRNRSKTEGIGGDITVRGDRLMIPNGGGIISSVERDGQGDSGNILIEVRELDANSFSFQTNTLGNGSSGDIKIVGTDSVRLQRGSILARVNPSGTGEAGEVVLETPNLELLNGGRIIAGTEGDGPGGNILVRVSGEALISGKAPPEANCNSTCESGFHSTVGESAEADRLNRGGSIDAEVGQLTIANGGRIDVSSSKLGQAGDIKLTVNSLEISGAGQVRSSALGAGKGGEIEVVASDRISITDPESGLIARTGNSGNAGEITIQTPTLSIQHGGQVATAAEASASGNAGGVRISPGQSKILDITLQGGTVTAETQSSGDGGDLIFSAPEAINIRGNGILTAQTSDTGSAGNVRVTSDRLTIDEGTTLSTTATATANPPANENGTKANIDLTANEMNLYGTVQVLSETQGNAQAGRLTLQPNGGQDLTINLREESRVSASTTGSGDGGQLSIIAPRAITISGKGSLSAETRGPGKAGAVQVQAQQFTLENGAELSTSTSGSGDGGNININASDSVTLRHQAQLLAQSTNQASGKAGEIAITTGQLELSNEAGITSRSNNTGDGGNITINASRPVLLRNGSVVETDAGGSGNGGNIAITTPFLIGLGGANADIIANAVSGDGGRITINTQRLLNFEIKDGENRTSLLNNSSNDISASSETGTSGRVALDTLNVDPSRGLAELPTDLTDPGDRISQGCRASSDINSFVTSGRGGIPQGPDGPLLSGTTTQGWITAEGEVVSPQVEAIAPAFSEASRRVAEVQGWRWDGEGRLRLVEPRGNGLGAAVQQVAVNCKAEPVPSQAASPNS